MCILCVCECFLLKRNQNAPRPSTGYGGFVIPFILDVRLLNNWSPLFWCPYMVINVSVQCNGGLLPDIILLTLCDFIGEPF